MSGRHTLAAARSAGIRIDLDGGQLQLQADKEPAATLLEALRCDKEELVALLGRGDDGFTGEDWLDFYDERAAILEHEIGLPRRRAEQEALEHCISRWLASNPPKIPSDYCCVSCGRATTPSDMALALFDGEHHAWIHPRCHVPFLRKRRTQAIGALGRFGIGPTSTDQATTASRLTATVDVPASCG